MQGAKNWHQQKMKVYWILFLGTAGSKHDNWLSIVNALPKSIPSIYYSTVTSFYLIRKSEHAKYPSSSRPVWRHRNYNKRNFRRIINPLLDGLTDNTCRHFTHCSQLVNFPRMLSVKPSNNDLLLDKNSFHCSRLCLQTGKLRCNTTIYRVIRWDILRVLFSL